MQITVCTENRGPLSLQRTTALKGLFAIGVLLSHVIPASGVFGDGFFTVVFTSLGYLAVSLFFFLSGYGIMAQYEAKGQQYLNTFMRKRVLSIYLLALFLIALYAVALPLLGQPYEMGELIQSFLFGYTIVSNGWYLQVVVLFYLLFYLCFRLVSSPEKKLPVLVLLILAYMLVASLFLYSRWYECSLPFLLGFVWKKHTECFDRLFFKSLRRYLLLLLLTLACFVAVFLLPDYTQGEGNLWLGILRIFLKCLSAPLFVLLLIPFFVRVRFENCAPLRLLAKYSIDIYVLQGLALHFFRASPLAIENEWLYLLLSILGTALLSVALHPIIQFILHLPQKTFQRGTE